MANKTIRIGAVGTTITFTLILAGNAQPPIQIIEFADDKAPVEITGHPTIKVAYSLNGTQVGWTSYKEGRTLTVGVIPDGIEHEALSTLYDRFVQYFNRGADLTVIVDTPNKIYTLASAAPLETAGMTTNAEGRKEGNTFTFACSEKTFTPQSKEII